MQLQVSGRKVKGIRPGQHNTSEMKLKSAKSSRHRRIAAQVSEMQLNASKMKHNMARVAQWVESQQKQLNAAKATKQHKPAKEAQASKGSSTLCQ
jgi:hypothetical protein